MKKETQEDPGDTGEQNNYDYYREHPCEVEDLIEYCSEECNVHFEKHEVAECFRFPPDECGRKLCLLAQFAIPENDSRAACDACPWAGLCSQGHTGTTVWLGMSTYGLDDPAQWLT